MKTSMPFARRSGMRIATLTLTLTLTLFIALASGSAHAQPEAAATPSEQALGTGAAGQPPIEDLANFPRTTLEIVSGAKRHRFEVWIADTDARKEQGLMFVRDLPENEGMLFPDCCTGIWMKNTYIELDIVFVGKDGRIAKIAPRAHPFDETTIPAPGPVEAVVELKGGEAQQLGLKVGDRVAWGRAATPPAATR